MLKVVETERAANEWLVQPVPGYVLKFKDVVVLGSEGEERCKVFVNVCHCAELPPPIDDITQEELLKRFEAGDESFKVPLVIGELGYAKDKNDEDAVQLNALVNSGFWERRLAPKANDVFRNFFAQIVTEAVDQKHGIKLDANRAIQLVNRKFYGDATPMRVNKRPARPVIEVAEEGSKKLITPVTDRAGTSKSTAVKKDPVFVPLEEVRSEAEMALVDGERTLEIRYILEKAPFKPDGKRDYQRLSTKANDERVLLVWDEGRASRRTLFDVTSPFRFDPNNLKLKIDEKYLVITAPVMFS